MQLLQRVQSKRLSLSKRLRALGELAQKVDAYFCQMKSQSSVPVPEDEALPIDDTAVPSAPDDAQAVATCALADAMKLLYTANQIARGQLLPHLLRYHVRLASIDALTEAQLTWLQSYFRRSIYPLLIPLAVDPAHPFPRVAPGALYFLVTLRAFGQLCRLQNDQLPWPTAAQHPVAQARTRAYMDEREVYGLINLSASGSRLIPLPADETTQPTDPTLLLWREEIIRHFIAELFVGMEVTGIYQFRVLRAGSPTLATPCNNEWAGQESSARMGQIPVVRMDVEQGMPAHLVNWLVDRLHTSGDCVLPCVPPLAMADLDELVDYVKPIGARRVLQIS